MYQIHSCSTQTNHCVKSVQISTRKNSVIGHLSHSELYNVLCLSLKEMQNYKRKLFLCPPHQHLKTAVCHNKFSLHHLKPNIYIKKTNFGSHKQYLFRLFTSRNAKKTQKDQRMPCIFLLCMKKTTHKSLKVAAAKSPVCMCMLLVQLASTIVFHSM